MEESKENNVPSTSRGGASALPAADPAGTGTTTTRSSGLSYRSIFAVLTWDSVILYDTYHTQPLSIVRGLHYCNIVDAEWSADGHNLLVCSTDGYISILQFSKGELGEVYVPPRAAGSSSGTVQGSATKQNATAITMTRPPMGLLSSLPPCEAGSAAVLEAPPTKRIKTCASLEQASSSSPLATSSTASAASKEEHGNACASSCTKRSASDHEEVGQAVNKLTLGETVLSTTPNTATVHQLQPKKKKRVQPILLATTN